MATMSGTFGSSPIWSYNLTLTCTNRTTTKATIKIDLSLGLYIQSSATKFGYNYYWNPVIIGDSTSDGGWIWVKDSTPNWSDGKKRNYTYTGTVNLAASKNSVTVKFNTKSTQTSGSKYSPAVSKSFTVPIGNTAPFWTGENDLHVKLNNKVLKVDTIIPENTGNIVVNTPTANDNEQTTLNYFLNRHVNNVDHGRIKTWTNASKNTRFEHTDSLATFGPGSKIRYYYYCEDGNLSASGTRRSWEYTKNTMQKGSIKNVGSIQGIAGKFSFTLEHATNQGGECNNTMSYTLSSATSGVTVYGVTTKSSSAAGSTTWEVLIGNTGTYLDINQLKNVLKDSGYKGNIKLKITASNSYGSNAVHEFNVYVDLVQQMGTPTVSFSGGTSTNGKYLTERSTFNVSWNNITDPLGTVSYKLYYNTGGANQLIASKATGQLSHSVNLNSIFGNKNVSNLRFVVEAISSYGGNSSIGQSSVINTYEYKKPTIGATKVLRAGANGIIEGIINDGSPVTIAKCYWRKSTDATSVENEFKRDATSGSYKITATNLPDTACSIILSVKDSINTVISIECKIAALHPLLTIRPEGVGINGINKGTGALHINSPDATTIDIHSFNKKDGIIKFTCDDIVDGKEKYIEIRSKALASMSDGGQGKGIQIKSYNMQTGQAKAFLDVDGEIYADSGKKVYHQGNLNASNIGAIPNNGSSITLNNSTAGQLKFKKTTGEAVECLYITSSNNLRVGNSSTQLYLHSSGNPKVTIGSNSYEIYHTGKKPTLSELGGDTGWVDLKLTNGAINKNKSRYRKIGNIVYVEFSVSGLSQGGGSASAVKVGIANLPTGCRPLAITPFLASAGATLTNPARFDLETDGTIYFRSAMNKITSEYVVYGNLSFMV